MGNQSKNNISSDVKAQVLTCPDTMRYNYHLSSLIQQTAHNGPLKPFQLPGVMSCFQQVVAPIGSLATHEPGVIMTLSHMVHLRFTTNIPKNPNGFLVVPSRFPSPSCPLSELFSEPCKPCNLAAVGHDLMQRINTHTPS